MRNYGQFCPIARGSEILAERWTPIIVRNVLLGCCTYNDIAAGAPGLSRALLTRRLRELHRAGVIDITPKPDGRGSLYTPTRAGRELWEVLGAISTWAERWTDVTSEHADPEAVLWSWTQAYLRRDLLPDRRVVVRFDFSRDGRPAHLWLHVERGDAEICRFDPQFGDDVVVTVADPVTFARWHLGLVEWPAALRSGGVAVAGPTALRRAVPTWNASPDRHARQRAEAQRVPGGPEDLPLEAVEAPSDVSHDRVAPGRAPDGGAATPAGAATLPSGAGPVTIPGFEGRVVAPADADYDRVRTLWNGAIDRRPRLIAQCLGSSDVVAALRFAREQDLPVSVRGGGHGVAGAAICDDGVVIDLGAMKRIDVDPGAGTVTAQAGALWGELDGATSSVGMATTGGIVSHTGIAGLTLGGGIGWLMRPCGLVVDNLVAADVVTADGERVRASEREEPDLFWGLRGGGPGLGVVTSFTYRLHPMPAEVLAGHVIWPLEDAGEVLRAYRAFTETAPPEVATIVTVRRAPASAHLPVELHGRPVCLVGMLALAPPGRAERLLAPLRSMGEPLLDRVRYRPYPHLQSMVDATVPHGWHYYWKATGLPSLSDGAIDVMVDQAGRAASPWSFAVLFHLGGRVAEIDPASTAYARRHIAHELVVNAAWVPDAPLAEVEPSWARGFVAALQPHGSGAYLNFLDHDDAEGAAFTPAVHRRLDDLRAHLDPAGVLRPPTVG